MTNHVTPLDVGVWAMTFFFAGLSHVGVLRASGGGGEDGTGGSKGTKQSANAVGLKSFGFLDFGLQKAMVLAGCGCQRESRGLLVPGCE